ncbi:hypothetical protein QFC19_009039 [Naganishia cerealis]|uniref:Uncharacterized protein n=1 Tax=Naganishia cerealis TaxID=610337 RepID=A0ACC2UWY7_9TREE|nr:hypothetical protein QFC19_009039 [Naganishia cerealis]
MGGEAAVERDPPTTTTATALKSANPEHALRRSKVIRGNEAPGIHTRANAGVGTSAPVMQGSSSSSSVSGVRDRPLQFEQRPGRSHRDSYPTTCMTTTDGKENEMIGDDDQGDNADHEDVVGRSPSFSSLRRTRGSQAPSDSDSDSGSTMSTAASESELDAAVSSSSRNDAPGSPLSPPVEVNVSAQVRRRIVEEEDAKRSRKKMNAQPVPPLAFAWV